MKEASVKAGPNTNHVQFPEEAVQALPATGSKAPSTRLHCVPGAGCESTSTGCEEELPSWPALLFTRETHSTSIRHRGSSAAAAPQASPAGRALRRRKRSAQRGTK